MNMICIKLKVNNHPGVMSHITGLFSRRGFNLEGIICAPVPDSDHSIMKLYVIEDHRLEQIEKQLSKLYDVISIEVSKDKGSWAFKSLQAEVNR